jgi:hypothetical protein
MGDVATVNQSWIEHHPPQLWAIALAVLMLAWLLGLAVLWLNNARRLDRDPLQNELTHFIIGMMVRGADKDAQDSFVIHVRHAFMKATVSNRAGQQKRLTHALLRARPKLGRAGYESARSIILRIT